MEKDYEKIELRSEKVRNIIGCVPPVLMRCGITILVFLLAGLFLATYFIPYPENIKTQVEVFSDGKSIIAFIPYSEVKRIAVGMAVSVEIEGYNARIYGYRQGEIVSIKEEVIKREGVNCFSAIIKLKNAADYRNLKKGMIGSATILVSDRSIMRLLFEKNIL